MIRSLILGLSFIFFSISAFIAFKAIDPSGSSKENTSGELSAIYTPPSPPTVVPSTQADTLQQIIVAGSDADKVFMEEMQSAITQIDKQLTTTEEALADVKMVPHHDQSRILAVFDGKVFRSGQDITQSIDHLKIESLIKEISASQNGDISIEGHTDNIPTANPGIDNMALSLRRAQGIADILIAHGIPSSRIAIKGFGDTRPIDPSNTAEARAKNRRVEIILIPKEGDH